MFDYRRVPARARGERKNLKCLESLFPLCRGKKIRALGLDDFASKRPRNGCVTLFGNGVGVVGPDSVVRIHEASSTVGQHNPHSCGYIRDYKTFVRWFNGVFTAV